MGGGEGHGPALEPAVEDFGNAPQKLPLLRNDEAIDALAVQVCDVSPDRRALFQLRHRPNAFNHFVVLVRPDRNRVAPVPVAREAPVLRVFKPVLESLFLGMPGHPSRLPVVSHHPLLQLFVDPDEPAQMSSVDEGGLRPPAEGVGVGDASVVQDPPLFLQIFDDDLVCVFEIQIFQLFILCVKAPVVVEQPWRDMACFEYLVLDAGVVVVLSVGRSAVHHSRPTVGTHELSSEYLEGVAEGFLEEVVGRLVLGLREFRALVPLAHLDLAFLELEELGDEGKPLLHENVLAAADLSLDVDLGRVEGEHEVAGEGPWSCGPDEEGGVVVANGEAYEKRGVLDLLVVLVGFEVGEDRGAGRAVGHDSGCAVYAVLEEELLEEPPHALHVAEVWSERRPYPLSCSRFRSRPTSQSGRRCVPTRASTS